MSTTVTIAEEAVTVEISSGVSQAQVDSSVAAHSAATDPHGDRAYAAAVLTNGLPKATLFPFETTVDDADFGAIVVPATLNGVTYDILYFGYNIASVAGVQKLHLAFEDDYYDGVNHWMEWYLEYVNPAHNVTTRPIMAALNLADATDFSVSHRIGVGANSYYGVTNHNASLWYIAVEGTTGYVGIGKTFGVGTILYPFDVAGKIRSTDTVLAKSGATGSVQIRSGSVTKSGLVEWHLPGADGALGTRLAYIGEDTANLTLTLVGGAQFHIPAGYVCIGTTSVGAKLSVDGQVGGTAPVVILRQLDNDEPFIGFTGTTAADQTKSLSTLNGDGAVTGPKNYSAAAGWEWAGMVKVHINGAPMWMPYYRTDLE